MKILGIDTSCDDTAISLIKAEDSKFLILSNVVSSQVKIHEKYGGVYPFLAKREHQKNLPIVFKKATKDIDISKIDFIGVTIGPGLEPCLWQGVNFAKDLAKKLKKPLIPVNHIEAHIIANFISSNFQFPIFNFQKIFPAACLVVSGGHTQLILMKAIGKYKLIGETRDDAAGECFDKVARTLGLGYPGGPAIAQAVHGKFEIQPRSISNRLDHPTSPFFKKVRSWRNSKIEIKLPRPMISQKNYDFSFSGLKTAVLYDFRSRSPKIQKSKEYIQVISFETQQAIIDVLIEKTLRAARDFKVKSVILGGGVVANEELRKQFKLKIESWKLKIDFFVPQKKFCTDNATMVAATAYFHQKEATKKWQEIKANANLRI